MSYLYGRKCRLLVRNGEDTALDVSDLRITFKIPKTIIPKEVYTEFNIYNLNPETEKIILNEGSQVIFEAGYEGDNNYGCIFNGELLYPLRYKENQTDYVLKLICLDSSNYLSNAVGNFTLTKGQNAREMVNALTYKSTVSSELGSISDDLDKTQKTTRGKTFFGCSSHYLRQIAQSNKAYYYHNDGKVNIIKVTDFQPTDAVEINAKTGMIGFPEQIAETFIYGINVKTLLNPRITLNTWLKLNNQDIKAQEIRLMQLQALLDMDGYYIVREITYNGDTRGNDWYSDIFASAQSGAIPTMMQDPFQFTR